MAYRFTSGPVDYFLFFLMNVNRQKVVWRRSIRRALLKRQVLSFYNPVQLVHLVIQLS